MGFVPVSIPAGTPWKPPPIPQIVATPLPGVLFRLSWWGSDYTLITAREKPIRTTCHHQCRPSFSKEMGYVHFRKYPRGMGLIRAWEGLAKSPLCVCPPACKEVKKCQNRLREIAIYSMYVYQIHAFIIQVKFNAL